LRASGGGAAARAGVPGAGAAHVTTAILPPPHLARPPASGVSLISIDLVCQSTALLSGALSMTKVANPVTVLVNALPLHLTIGIRNCRCPLLNMQAMAWTADPWAPVTTLRVSPTL